MKPNFTMISSIFKTSKNKRFNFKPRYYDEAKAELDARLKSIKKDIELQEKNQIQKGLLQSNWRRNKLIKEQKKSNNRLVIIIGVLLLVAYWILK